ncbi:hypothetical protein SCHPADRAFT_882612 [Schizopora paradoxa]|uniref:Uncharacterized protein n=1 Tax=Schizopora paradoxa TaxID=27342 RepID=A0A0H2R492_9AGAM|nr:hypothetical protein SCHPADRAFT_882612 [Schizopora paradoxa]
MHLPYTHLLVQESRSIAITAGGQICVFETSTGQTLASTAELERDVVKLESVVVADICGEDREFLATITQDKTLRIWKIEDLSIVNERTVIKIPTCLKVTKDGSTIIISDKFGDVYSFSVIPPGPTSILTSHENLKRTKPVTLESLGGKLLMGHVSLLTTFLLTHDEKFIITADRDEHIRVSWYPESYVIESYCLGQKKFVSSLHIPSWDSSRLLSGGGDPEIKLWNWMDGRLLAKYSVAHAVFPFVKIFRRVSGGGNASGGEADGEPKKPRKKLSHRKLRKKGKEGRLAYLAAIQKEGEAQAEDVSEQMDIDNPSTPVQASTSATDERLADPTLVISKIETLETSSQKLCFFSAIGSTALFYFELPDTTETSSSQDVVIKHCDVGKLILSFHLLRDIGEIWLLTDGECTEESILLDDPTPKPMVQVLRLDAFQLTETPESTSYPGFLNALNSSPIIRASNKNIDLYALLSSLPKHTSGELEDDDDEDTGEVQEISKKEQGRMKAKRARDAAALKLASETGDAVDSGAEDRDAKKTKSES